MINLIMIIITVITIIMIIEQNIPDRLLNHMNLDLFGVGTLKLPQSMSTTNTSTNSRAFWLDCSLYRKIGSKLGILSGRNER